MKRTRPPAAAALLAVPLVIALSSPTAAVGEPTPPADATRAAATADASGNAKTPADPTEQSAATEKPGAATEKPGSSGAKSDAPGTQVERIVVLDPNQAAQLAPTAQRGKALGRVRAQQSALQAGARAAGIKLRTTYTYQHVVNGLAVSLPADQVDELAALPGVTQVVQPQRFDPPPPIPRLAKQAQQRALAAATDLGRDNVTVTKLTGVRQAHQRGFDGEGVTIGILDSGIAWDLPAFGGGTFPNERVVGGYDFADGDPDPYDDGTFGASGHGTHVAGIALGNDDKMTGVAPAAKLRAYRVFNDEGASEQSLLAALDRAAADKVDVINMSLGQTGMRSNSPISLAVDQVSASGIPVVVAIGNGLAGPFNAGSPAVARSAIAVGSVYSEQLPWLAFTLNDGSGDAIPYVLGSSNGRTPATGTFPVVELTGGCDPLPAGSLTGKIALFGALDGFECRGMDQARVAEAAGAAGAFYYNDQFNDEDFPFTICCGPAVQMPIAMLRGRDAKRILATDNPTISWGAYAGEQLPDNLKGRPALLSSWGPGNELEFKPDVVAPGEGIFSTVPPKMGYYAQNSGTSMAAPHVTGVIALLRQANRSLTPEQLATVVANTARPAALTAGDASRLHPTAQQGSGLVNAAAALDLLQQKAPTVTPSRLAFGDLEGRQAVRQLQVTNPGATPVSYRVEHRPAVSAAPPYTGSWKPTAAAASARATKSIVTVRPGATTRVNVTVREPAGVPAGTLLGGWFELTPVTPGQRAIRVPYQAVSGDLDAVSAINPTFTDLNPGLDNPALRPADFSFGKSEPITVDLTDDDTGNDSAWVMVSHGFPLLERFRLQVLNAKGRVVATPVDESWVTRNSGAGTGMDFLSWDATLPGGGTAPAGEYRLRLVFDKAMGDPDGAPAQQTWTSPVVTLVS
ncbi:S8 family serine peptidase [Nakamurella aerolata]|uniref:S8 family serine peptidase n=1 Tax=Nakamurella aerolata TaxID=1656892 RepID=A0A849AEP2_9ACTN|nr:S8 family serine peptidase [Nakamurella aerolata]NNG35322.1 S8 family serine peptidase [Nakamurella aerolata]